MAQLYDYEFTEHVLYIIYSLPRVILFRYYIYDNDIHKFDTMPIFEDPAFEYIKTILFEIDAYCDQLLDGEESSAKPSLNLSQRYKGKTAIEHFDFYIETLNEYEEKTG